MISNIYYNAIIYILIVLVLGLIFIYINNLKEKFITDNQVNSIIDRLLKDRNIIDKISEIIRVQDMKSKDQFTTNNDTKISNLKEKSEKLITNYLLKSKSMTQFIEDQELKYKKMREDYNLKKLDIFN